MKTDQVFDISAEDSPFKLKNQIYHLNGGFKIVCNISQNIHCFDIYHDGYPIGTVDVKMADVFYNSIIEAQSQNKIIALNISIKSNKEPERINSNIMMGGNAPKTIGYICFWNKNGGTIFEPLSIEIDTKEIPHLCIERKVLFEKIKKPKLEINLGDYIFGIDVCGDLKSIVYPGLKRNEKNRDFQPVVLDYLIKL